MIKLKQILFESLTQSVYDFIKQTIKGTEWEDKVYAVGGYVRDKLMGLNPKDIDLMVDMKDGGIKFAEWITKKLNIYKEGSNPIIFPTFGTAKFNLRGIKFQGYDLSEMDIEAVMPRGEKYIEGSRNPETFYVDLKQDAERRDLTINALFQRLSDDEILDLTGYGKEDLRKKLIRTPLDAKIIFKDDPLRMLRVIRFAVKYGFDINLQTIRAMKENADLLSIISKERIQDELNKMLLTKNPDKAIRLLKITGLYKYVIPELEQLFNLEQNKKYHNMDVFNHTMNVLKNVPADLKTRLSALFHDIGKGATKEVIENEVHFYKHEDVGADMAEEIMKRLKYPNDIIISVTTAIRNHMRMKGAGMEGKNISDKALRKLKRDLGDHLEHTLDLMHSDNLSHSDTASMPNQIPALRQRLSTVGDVPSGQHIKLPVNGLDLMKAFDLKPSKKLGDLLKKVEDAYLENPHLTKQQALDVVKKELKGD